MVLPPYPTLSTLSRGTMYRSCPRTRRRAKKSHDMMIEEGLCSTMILFALPKYS